MGQLVTMINRQWWSQWLISYCVPEIFAIKSRSCPKSRQNFDVFGPPILGEGLPKFLTQFYKLMSPPNMWRSLVTIGIQTSDSEIRRWTKEIRSKHPHQNISQPGQLSLPGGLKRIYYNACINMTWAKVINELCIIYINRHTWWTTAH